MCQRSTNCANSLPNGERADTTTPSGQHEEGAASPVVSTREEVLAAAKWWHTDVSAEQNLMEHLGEGGLRIVRDLWSAPCEVPVGADQYGTVDADAVPGEPLIVEVDEFDLLRCRSDTVGPQRCRGSVSDPDGRVAPRPAS